MCENATRHSARFWAVQQKWFSEGEISGWRKGSQSVMAFRVVPKRLQWSCFYHKQDFAIVIKGNWRRRRDLKLYCVMPHEPFPLLNSVCRSSSEFLLFILQNDDGPDVRAGSGDILLVHATETERKGTLWRCSHSLCVLLTGQCVGWLWGDWNGNFIFQNRFVMTNWFETWTLIFFPCVFVWQILFCTVKLFWQHIGLL